MKNWKAFGRKWWWPDRCTILTFEWGSWGKLRKTLVRIAGDPTEIP
jgi:hypothetical protein